MHVGPGNSTVSRVSILPIHTPVFRQQVAGYLLRGLSRNLTVYAVAAGDYRIVRPHDRERYPAGRNPQILLTEAELAEFEVEVNHGLPWNLTAEILGAP